MGILLPDSSGSLFGVPTRVLLVCWRDLQVMSRLLIIKGSPLRLHV